MSNYDSRDVRNTRASASSRTANTLHSSPSALAQARVHVANAGRAIEKKIDKLPVMLKPEQLRNLNEHKYSSSGATLLDPIFQPFWKWLVEQMPMWVAPNLITMVGLIINVVTSVIVMIYSPDARNDLPSWCCVLCGLGLFIYQSLDAIDGKQARRTNSSSPLGELFDHGCDAVSTVFVITSLCTALKLGNCPGFLMLMCFVALSAFYIAHWQTYVTGSLKFGLIDVTEAQASIYCIYFLTAIFGDSIWSIPLPIISEVRFIPALMAISGSGKAIYVNLRDITRGGKGKHGATVADTSIVFPGFPLAIILISAITIAAKSPNNLFENHQCLYMMTFGFFWAKSTIQLIVAHMTKGEIHLIDSSLVGPFALLLNQYFNCFCPEVVLLVGCLAWGLFDLIKYCSKVCLQICHHMNIFLFKIRPNLSASAHLPPAMTTRSASQQSQNNSSQDANRYNH